GVKFENCWLTDAVHCPIAVVDGDAPADRPIVIDRVRCTTRRDYTQDDRTTLAAAIAVTGKQEAAPPAIVIRHCRIEGRFRSGISLAAPVQAQIELNRMYQPPQASRADAVCVAIPDSGGIKLKIVSNTIAGYSTLLRTDRVPAAGCTFLLRSNLAIDAQAFVV